jgi:hypothetical protein
MKMEAIFSSETSSILRTAYCQNPKLRTLPGHKGENLKFKGVPFYLQNVHNCSHVATLAFLNDRPVGITNDGEDVFIVIFGKQELDYFTCILHVIENTKNNFRFENIRRTSNPYFTQIFWII